MMANDQYPDAEVPSKIGTYAALTKAGGGYVWDAVLEYRVWCSPSMGAEDLEEGSDYFYSFGTYNEARNFCDQTNGAKDPLALIRQDEYLDEPSPGQFVHVRKVRIAEWHVGLLTRPKRTNNTIPAFLAAEPESNRLDVIRGNGNANKGAE